jgi:hypothetical protein
MSAAPFSRVRLVAGIVLGNELREASRREG